MRRAIGECGTRLALALVVAGSLACGGADDRSHAGTATEPATLPTLTLGALPDRVLSLPFPDNPDPEQCGIPTPWGKDDPAWLSGVWEGELVQPVVYLYDSHLRAEVIGQIPHGGRVEIQLFQSNPVLHFYRVRSLDASPPQDGWVPAPFVVFEPVT